VRASNLFWPTLRQEPAEAELISHRLLLRAGFIRRLAAGIYSFLPLGWRVIDKVSNIVRQEMNRAGAQELLLPTLHPEELWQQSGRSEKWGPELMRLQDRAGRTFCLGATHEEVITALVGGEVSSHRDLPFILYQIQTKFRDEPRPRGGLIRGREFEMKDAYSFDLDDSGLEKSYRLMEQAYKRVFERCGLPYHLVEADASAMGGSAADEFMFEAPSGEDTFFTCPSCGYAASIDKAARSQKAVQASCTTQPPAAERVATPGLSTVEQVSRFLGVAPCQLIKTLICVADGKPVAVLIAGDRELNQAKLLAAAGAASVELASAEVIERVTSAPVGFAGPVGLKGVPIIADYDLHSAADMVTGANEADAHLIHVTLGRDFQVDRLADLRNDVDGDPCPRCSTALVQKSGIELGHIFKLGTSYSERMNAAYVGPEGKQHPIVMGCYGIGISRLVAAAVEAYHDDDGIIWPLSIAPFHVIIVVVNSSDQAQAALAEQAHSLLEKAALEPLLDDRALPPGPKFKDADLVGIPLQIIVGKKAAAGQVEVRRRRVQGSQFLAPEEAAAWAQKMVQSACPARECGE